MASLLCYTEHVQRYLSVILKCGRIALSPGKIKIINGMPSCPPYMENSPCDRFKVTVPYAGHPVSWDVIFYAKKPEIAPDLIFSYDAFPIELEQLNALVQWDSNRPEGLLDLIREVLQIFGIQQTIQLSKYARLHFEYATLLQQEGFSEDDIEVFMSTKMRGPVSFLIRLPIEFSNIPPLLTRKNPDEDSVLLHVTFQTPEGCRMTPQLFLSPRVERAVGGAQDWRLPNLTADGCLMDYVPILIDILDVRIKQVSESFKKRKEYVTTFLVHLENCLLEYDAESFCKMSFLLENNMLFFILHIELSHGFPIDKPIFIFQSIYHKIGGRPFSITVEYPHNPHWNAHEAFQRAKSFILQHLSIFQQTLQPCLRT